jgi:antitoxin HicB
LTADSPRRKIVAQEIMAEYGYTVLFEPAEEGGYIAFCPVLPGCVTEGRTLDEARAHAKEAIAAYLASLRKDGIPPPADKSLALESVKEVIHIAAPEPA